MALLHDGAILFFPIECGELWPKGKDGPWRSSFEKAKTWMIYLPKGNPKDAIKAPLGVDYVHHAAPLPGGAWLIRKRTGEKLHGSEAWFPPDLAHERSKLGPLLEELGSEDFAVRERAVLALRGRMPDVATTLKECLQGERKPATRAALEWLLRYPASGPLASFRCVGPFDGWYFYDAWSYRGEGEGARFLVVAGLTREPGAPPPLENFPSGKSPLSLVRFDANGKFSVVWKDFPGSAEDDGRGWKGAWLHEAPDGTFLFAPRVIYRPHPTIPKAQQKCDESFRLTAGVASPWPIQAPEDRHGTVGPFLAQIDRAGRLYYHDWVRGAFFVIPDVRGDPPRWKE